MLLDSCLVTPVTFEEGRLNYENRASHLPYEQLGWGHSHQSDYPKEVAEFKEI